MNCVCGKATDQDMYVCNVGIHFLFEIFDLFVEKF